MLYEKPDDVAAEREIAERYASIASCIPLALPRKSVVDFVFVRGSAVVCLVEVRTRGCRHMQFADYMLSMSKWIAVKAVSVATQTPAVFLVMFAGSSTLYVLKAEGDPDSIDESTGRTDRNDPNDVGPAGHFNWSRLKKVRGT